MYSHVDGNGYHLPRDWTRHLWTINVSLEMQQLGLQGNHPPTHPPMHSLTYPPTHTHTHTHTHAHSNTTLIAWKSTYWKLVRHPSFHKQWLLFQIAACYFSFSLPLALMVNCWAHSPLSVTHSPLSTLLAIPFLLLFATSFTHSSSTPQLWSGLQYSQFTQSAQAAVRGIDWR